MLFSGCRNCQFWQYFQRASRGNAHAPQACAGSLGNKCIFEKNWPNLLLRALPPKNIWSFHFSTKIPNLVSFSQKCTVSQGPSARLGGERERLLPGADCPSTIKLTFLNVCGGRNCSRDVGRSCGHGVCTRGGASILAAEESSELLNANCSMQLCSMQVKHISVNQI